MAKDSFRVAAEAQGLAAAIKTLGKVDKELKKELVTSMKKAADPLVNEARSLVPAASPLSNWGNWVTPNGREIGRFDPAKVRRGIKVSQRNTAQRGTGGKREETIRLLALISSSAPGAIFDMAGRADGNGRGSEGAARGQAMIAKLNQSGRASRTLWPAAERRLGEVQDAVRDAIADMEDTLQKELEAR